MDDIKPKGENESDPILDLQNKLYSRTVGQNEKEDSLRFHSEDYGVKKDWTKEKDARPFFGNTMSLVKKILLSSFIFFGFSAVFVSYVFFWGGNSVSTENVDIEILGPVSIGGGEELSLEISIANKNNVDLQSADLLVEYPEGARKAEDLNSEARRYREFVGDIPSGGKISKKVSVVLFGEENEKKQISASLDYRVAGSNAVFTKEKKYEISISSSPVTMVAEYPREANSGDIVEFVVSLESNSSEIIKGVLLEAEYPFGFSLASADPSPSYGNNAWALGDIGPKAKKTVKLRGKIEGVENDEKVWRWRIGAEDPMDEKKMGVVFLQKTESLAIRKPFIGIDLSLNGEGGKDYAGKKGENVRGEISWQNNLPDNIVDVRVEAKLSGNALDRESVGSASGFYRSSDNTIVWDQTRNRELAEIGPGEGGRFDFDFSSLKNYADSRRGEEIIISANVYAKRRGERGNWEDVSGTAERKVKIATNLGLQARAVYSSGPFQNHGPLPPKADNETTYTIIWSLANSSNNLSGVRVLSRLPSYVKWLGAVSPASERVSFDPQSGQIAWNAGELKAGAGYGTGAREVAFQISFVPSLSQVGTTPVLIEEASAEGADSFAGISVKSNTRSPLTTALSGEGGNGTVTK